jgi:hypothetical protein
MSGGRGRFIGIGRLAVLGAAVAADNCKALVGYGLVREDMREK